MINDVIFTNDLLPMPVGVDAINSLIQWDTEKPTHLKGNLLTEALRLLIS